MFDRFNEKAVNVILIAQEESRRLGHNFVGTEQILLGLIREGTGTASSVLASLGIHLDEVRSQVEKLIGHGSGNIVAEIPFTARAKSVLELAGEVSVAMNHSYIGTEHLLLSVVREGEKTIAVANRKPSQSLAFQVLQNLGANPLSLCDRVIQAQALGEETQEERFSLRPFKEQLKALLPPMSDHALQVWHAMGSQMNWEETDTALNQFWIRWLTRLSQSEVQTALNELVELGVVARIEPV
ncbi:MAG: Clp protease N-terminal domain-containing protein [Leptolyngbya sp. BL-A-14]